MVCRFAKCLVLFFLVSGVLRADSEDANVHQVVVHGVLSCPASEDFEVFRQGVIAGQEHPVEDYQAFKEFFTHQVKGLTQLIESDNLFYAEWSVLIDEKLASLQLVEVLLAAISADDYEAFVSQGSDLFQKEITPEIFREVVSQLGDEEYNVSYLGTIDRKGVEVLLWKLSPSKNDFSEEKLASLVIEDDVVSGFWIH